MPTSSADPPWGSTPPTFLSSRSLAAAGMTRRGIADAVARGALVRVRRGRHVPAGTHEDVVSAAALGGRVDCVSLLRHLGVFVLDRHPLHIQVEVGSSRLPKRPVDVVCHWRVTDAPDDVLITDVVSALAQSCRCQGVPEAIATLDSAWHLGLVDERGIAEVFVRLPAGHQALRPLLDPRCESGTETIMRLILRAMGCHVDVQVHIEGVGRVDFVVDGWLIIECDSEAHHSGWAQQKRDRRRDIAAARLGYTTIRPVAEDIFYRREDVVAAVAAVLAQGSSRGAVRNSSNKGRGRGRTARSAAEAPVLRSCAHGAVRERRAGLEKPRRRSPRR